MTTYLVRGGRFVPADVVDNSAVAVASAAILNSKSLDLLRASAVTQLKSSQSLAQVQQWTLQTNKS